MTTIINTPPPREDMDSGVGIIIGVLVAIVLIVLFFVYALPAIQNNQAQKPDNTIDVNIKVPPATNQTPSTNNTKTTTY
ncbi:hypothetical protein EPO17_01170 [Patescibacteria group bacterium]|nr:MAG: hypothetical protein EPO17_01170 [Patescibacteria group bacterium]